ncbi:MAG: putative ABC transporter permease [Lachnospiraceae bacterium]|nr:putative ABC transporter permease [Lachnospiraceae bacterium]
MFSSQLLSLSVNGSDLYHVISWFWIYSFLGWIWESSYVSIRSHKLVNRGFVSGPALTIYGAGAVAVYLIMKPFSGNVLLLYLGGVAVATILEYITGMLMEAIFHTNWWDYSHKKFNLQGKICLESSLFWGVMTLVLFYVFQPFVDAVVELLPRMYGEITLNIVMVVYCVDFGMSAFAAFHIKDKLISLDKTWDEFVEYLEKSRLGEAAEALKARASMLHHEFSGERTSAYLLRGKESLEAYLNRISEIGTEKREEITSKFDSFSEKYLNGKKAMDKITQRYVKAYPNLELSEKRKAARKAKKNKK